MKVLGMVVRNVLLHGMFIAATPGQQRYLKIGSRTLPRNQRHNVMCHRPESLSRRSSNTETEFLTMPHLIDWRHTFIWDLICVFFSKKHEM